MLLFPPVFAAIALAVSAAFRRSAKAQMAATVIDGGVFTVFCIAGGALAGLLMSGANESLAWVLCAGLGTTATLIIGRQSKESFGAIGGIGLVLISLCYLVMVGRQVQDNREEIHQRLSFVNEGEHIRSLAGIR